MNNIIDQLRNRMMHLTTDMADYGDDELRSIKSSAEVFAMKIRIELLNRDASMVDEAAKLKENDK